MTPINKRGKYTTHILNFISNKKVAKFENIQAYIVSIKDQIKFKPNISNKNIKCNVSTALNKMTQNGYIVPMDAELRRGQWVWTKYKLAENVFCENGEWFKGELENV